MKVLLLFALYVLFSLPGFSNNSETAQSVNDSLFRLEEKQISAIALKIASARFNNTFQDSLSKKLEQKLKEVIEADKDMQFPFDSLQGIGVSTSMDKRLRIFTWNIVFADGTYRYFGWMQYHSKDLGETVLFSLVDKSDEISDPEKASLTNENWYGAAYYQIVDVKVDREVVYTLLGWDGNNDYSNKKILDAVRFTNSGKPKFNNAIFSNGKVSSKRIIFEFSYMATMMLTYDHNYKLIVFDHLEPLSPIYRGNPTYYGPDLSYDAFRFENNAWMFISDYNYKKPEQKKGFSLGNVFKKK